MEPVREKEIDELLSRSISIILPSREALKQRLRSGKPLTVYIGADATGPELHLGHATNFIFLEKLRKMGHKVIVLFGDFTAMIGDPSDRDAERRPLSKKEVGENIKTWKQQVGKIIKISGSGNPAKVKKNSAWLSRLGFEKILEIASAFTVQQMLERDMFERRFEEKRPIHLHEFLYPLMQGYDSVAMDVDAEVGGNDQLFNMLAGRTLQKKYRNKEKFVIATTLLVNPETGKKLMSKSEGGYIALSDSPQQMYGKTMALPDSVVPQMFTDCTLLSLDEIRAVEAETQKGGNPRDAKMRLAFEIVKLYHGEQKANAAEAGFVSTFQKKETPTGVREVSAMRGTPLADVLVAEGLVASKSEFQRLCLSGGISVAGEDKKITDWKALVEPGTFRIGKHRFIKITVH